MLKELDSICKKGIYAGNRLKKFVLRNGFFELEFREEAEEGENGFAKLGKLKDSAIN